MQLGESDSGRMEVKITGGERQRAWDVIDNVHVTKNGSPQKVAQKESLGSPICVSAPCRGWS